MSSGPTGGLLGFPGAVTINNDREVGDTSAGDRGSTGSSDEDAPFALPGFVPDRLVPPFMRDVLATAERRGQCVFEQLRTILGGLGMLAPREPLVTPVPPPPDNRSTHGRAQSRSASSESPQDSGDEEPSEESTSSSSPTAVPSRPVPGDTNIRTIGAEQLAIPSYDSLSASQVVPRLASLDQHDLELIRAYESSGRGRRTILNRIDQLQDH